MLVSLLLLVEPFETLMQTTYPPEFVIRFFISYTIVYFLAIVTGEPCFLLAKSLKIPQSMAHVPEGGMLSV